MSQRVLIYLFPFILALMEWLLRHGIQVNSAEFLAPTIASAALGLLIPLTGIKNRTFALDETTRRQIESLKAVIVPKRERLMINVVWIIILLSLALWGCCLVFTCKPESNPIKLSPLWYASAAYFIALICSEIREAV
jgi:hypothetical protein